MTIWASRNATSPVIIEKIDGLCEVVGLPLGSVHLNHRDVIRAPSIKLELGLKKKEINIIFLSACHRLELNQSNIFFLIFEIISGAKLT